MRLCGYRLEPGMLPDGPGWKLSDAGIKRGAVLLGNDGPHVGVGIAGVDDAREPEIILFAMTPESLLISGQFPRNLAPAMVSTNLPLAFPPNASPPD